MWRVRRDCEKNRPRVSEAPVACSLIAQYPVHYMARPRNNQLKFELTAALERVLEALKDGAHTWDEINKATVLGDSHLGMVLGELLYRRRVRTEHQGDDRVYHLAHDRYR